jgi:hypothetical protein
MMSFLWGVERSHFSQAVLDTMKFYLYDAKEMHQLPVSEWQQMSELLAVLKSFQILGKHVWYRGKKMEDKKSGFESPSIPG